MTYNGQASAPAPITVVRSALGISALNQAGSGPGVLQNVNSSTDRPINSALKPARLGQAIILWGTGIGPVAGNEAAGPLPGNMPNIKIHVWVGALEASVQYRGRSGCCTGLDQIVFIVPSGIEGCAIPVFVQIDNVISNFVSMAIAKSGSVCSDATALSASLLQLASQNGGLRSGSLVVDRLDGEAGSYHSQSDGLGAAFLKVTLDSILHGFPPPKAGVCNVLPFPGYMPPSPVYLDAGKVSVTTPIGQYDLVSQQKGYSSPSARCLPGLRHTCQ